MDRLGDLNLVEVEMNNAKRWLRLGAAALAAAVMLTPALSHAQKKPNILVIFGDDIGQSNISAYTHGLMGYKTPHIDSIAKEGMMFTDYYAEQSCTAGPRAAGGQTPAALWLRLRRQTEFPKDKRIREGELAQVIVAYRSTAVARTHIDLQQDGICIRFDSA